MNKLYTITDVHTPAVPSETIIDGYIPEDVCDVLYERWKPTWSNMIEFPGNVKGISCEAILEVKPSTFNRVMGKARGNLIRKAAEENK